jgi:hypothetical protein
MLSFTRRVLPSAFAFLVVVPCLIPGAFEVRAQTVAGRVID